MTLHAFDGDDFVEVYRQLQRRLIEVYPTDVGQWQSQDVSSRPEMVTHELANVSIVMGLPQSAMKLGWLTGAHLPWAEDHFRERVGGEPLNPAPSEAWWPFASKKGQTTNEEHRMGEQFAHTYPERIWPKEAGKVWESKVRPDYDELWGNNTGVRFEYGDLEDVVNLLIKSPGTRQAFLPIWFPEDTGVVHGERVPCTLGYHFMIRNNQLQITYYMRSCDLIRHFQDDVYMAGRLAQWVRDELNKHLHNRVYDVGELVMHIVSLHCFVGDIDLMIKRDEDGDAWPTLTA